MSRRPSPISPSNRQGKERGLLQLLDIDPNNGQHHIGYCGLKSRSVADSAFLVAEFHPVRFAALQVIAGLLCGTWRSANTMSRHLYSDVLDDPDQWLTDLQVRWLRPRGAMPRFAYAVLYLINWCLMRMLFRITVVGCDSLPESGPVIVAPNHASPFDPPVLAAVFPLRMLQQTYWAGKQSTVLKNRLRRFLSWLTRVIPIGDQRTALASAVTILEGGSNLVWFPEGRRSLDGQLQAFKPGIAILLSRCPVPVVPVYIDGAFEAYPPGARLPRLRANITVRIGAAVSADQLGLEPFTDSNVNETVESLRQRFVKLRDG
jgi:long-chain acyl-CoA synthetase